MTFSDVLIIALLSQIPLALFNVWSGSRKLKPEIKKTQAEEKSSLSDAVEGAGKTLVDAWKHIEELEIWKRQATQEMVQLKDELRQWRNYAARLIKQIKGMDPNAEPVPFETNPRVIIK